MSSDAIGIIIENSVNQKYSKQDSIFNFKKRSSSRDISDLQTQTYYMKNLEYQLRFDNKSEYSKKILTHLEETLASIKYIKTIRKPSDETIQKSQFRLIPNDLVKDAKSSK